MASAPTLYRQRNPDPRASMYGEIQSMKTSKPLTGQDPRLATMMEYFGGVPKDLSIDHVYSHGSTYGTINDALMDRFAVVFKDKIYGLLKYKNWSPWIYLYPWHHVKPSDGIDLVYSEMVLADGIAPRLAPLGVPRLYEIKKSERGDRMVRRGAGIYIESTFFMTPEGQRRYHLQLAQLGSITLKTCEIDTGVEILNAWSNQPRRAYQLNGIYSEPGQDGYMDYLRAENEAWGTINKNPRSEAFINLLNRLETLMHVYRDGANPDTLVLPQNMKRFYMMHEDLRKYSEAGPDALKQRHMNLIPNESGVPLASFNGYQIVDVGLYRTTTASRFEAGDMFTVNAQIGGWVPMDANEHVPDEKFFDDDYVTRYRNTLMYNEDRDDIVEVKFEVALESLFGDGTAEANFEDWFYHTFEDIGVDSKSKVSQWFAKMAARPEYALHTRRIARFDYTAYLDEKCSLDTISAMARANLYIPISVILCRPYMTYSASTVILMKRGEETGQNYIGHTDFQVSAGSMKKDMSGSWTFFHKAFTKVPQNIFAIENCFIQRYRGGNNTEFIKGSNLLAEIQSEGGLAKPRQSIMAIMENPTVELNKYTVLDIANYGSNSYIDGHPPSFQKLANFVTINPNNVKDYAEDSIDFEFYNLNPNSVLWRDHYEYGPQFQSVKVNTGPWGRWIYPGVAKTRDAINYCSIEPLVGSRMMRSTR